MSRDRVISLLYPDVGPAHDSPLSEPGIPDAYLIYVVLMWTVNVSQVSVDAVGRGGARSYYRRH